MDDCFFPNAIFFKYFDRISVKYPLLAITTNGIWTDPEAKRLFVGGVDALIQSKKPINLIVCGKIPSWLFAKYPEVNIIGIPSFGQQWHERRCA